MSPRASVGPPTKSPKKLTPRQQLVVENDDLRARLQQAEESLQGILTGEADALFVPSTGGGQLFTLQGADQVYRALVENMSEGALTVTQEGVVLYANRRVAEMLRTPLEQVIGSDVHSWFASEGRQVLRGLLRAAASDHQRQSMDLTAADGTVVPVYLSVDRLARVEMPDSFCMVLTDLTEQIRERLRTEDSLRELNRTLEAQVTERTEAAETERRLLDAILDALPVAVIIADPGGRLTRMNRACEKVWGLAPLSASIDEYREWVGFWPDSGRRIEPHEWAMSRALLHGEICPGELLEFERFGDRSRCFIMNSAAPVRGRDGAIIAGVVASMDVTNRITLEEQIQASLLEKEVLLKEIHHRVKNNLQIISTLLDLQSEHTQDPRALEMFEESRGRVKAMALIHDRLYRSKDMASVKFDQYISQLAGSLYQAYKVSSADIVLRVSVSVPSIPIDVAIPCGLLLNELISNCLKHAFKDGAGGLIKVALHIQGGSNVLSVADNGAGLPAGIDFRNSTSFGLQLVNILVEQLRGEVELKSDRGAEFIIRFPRTTTGDPGTTTGELS